MNYLNNFGLNVCYKCKYFPQYNLITKTNAKKDYLLSENDLNSLPFWKKEMKHENRNNNYNAMNSDRFTPNFIQEFSGSDYLNKLCSQHYNNNYNNNNNNNSGNSSKRFYSTYMKLYLESKVKELSYAKWGDNDGIENEKQKREIKKLQKKINKHKQKKRKIQSLDDIKVSKQVLKLTENKKHKHEYNEATYDETNDEWSKCCQICDYVETWQEF